MDTAFAADPVSAKDAVIAADTSFAEALASGSPTPGGGGASAYCGALAAALASMVGNLTVGKKRYADVEDAVREELVELAEARVKLLDLVQADADAFEPLARAYRMASDTEEERTAKEAALQEALVDACEVPLAIMEQCTLVLESCSYLAHHGSRMAVSDAGVSAVFAKAALQGASLNVRINLASMADGHRAARYRDAMESLLDAGGRLADDIYKYVVGELG